MCCLFPDSFAFCTKRLVIRSHSKKAKTLFEKAKEKRVGVTILDAMEEHLTSFEPMGGYYTPQRWFKKPSLTTAKSN